MAPPLACRILGHRWRFWREEHVVRWSCARGCPTGGAREYEDAREAQRYLRYFDRSPGPPVAFLAALGGSVRRDRKPNRSQR